MPLSTTDRNPHQILLNPFMLTTHTHTHLNALRVVIDSCGLYTLNCVSLCLSQNWRSGSTAVLALIRGDKLYVGWVGDSQAALFKKGGEDVQLVQPHKPENEVSCVQNTLCQ